jgi:hypothetical protein
MKCFLVEMYMERIYGNPFRILGRIYRCMNLYNLHMKMSKAKKPRMEGEIMQLILPEKIDVDFKEIEQEVKHSDEYCWACDVYFGPPVNPGENEAMDALWNEYVKHRTTMSLEKLAPLLSRAHAEFIVKEAILNGEKVVKEWPEDICYRHLLHDLHDEKLRLRRASDRLGIIEEKLADTIFYREGMAFEGAMKSQGIKIDTKAIDKLAMITKLRLDIDTKLA